MGESPDSSCPPTTSSSSAVILASDSLGVPSWTSSSAILTTKGRHCSTPWRVTHPIFPQAPGRGVYSAGAPFEAGEGPQARFDPTTAGGSLYCGSVFFSGGHDPGDALLPGITPRQGRQQRVLHHAGSAALARLSLPCRRPIHRPSGPFWLFCPRYEARPSVQSGWPDRAGRRGPPS